MLLASLLFAAAAHAAPIADMPIVNPKASQPATCPATSRYEAAKRGKAPKAQKLNELPDADVYRTVYRRVGRCEAPIITKYGIAGG